MTEDEKEHASALLRMGEKLEAVRYLQETLDVDAEQALALAEKLDEAQASSEMRERLEELRNQHDSALKSIVPTIVGSIFMGLGLIMLGVAAYIIYADDQFAQRAVPVTGKTIGYSSYISRDDDGHETTMFTPIFEYTFNETKYTYKSDMSSSSKDFATGDPVEILVDPNDPESVLIHSFWQQYTLPMILGFLGVMFTGMGYMAIRIFKWGII